MRYKGKYCSAMPPRKRKNNRIWIGTVCALLAVAMIATGAVFAKYKQSVPLQGSLTVSSGHLANVFTLQEHAVVRNSDGTYSPHGSDTGISNAYQVMPGVSLPKDPHFTLRNKSKVPAYLYVEIIDGISGSGLSYDVTSDWLDLGLTGQNGGKVYVYTGGAGSAKLLDENFNVSTIYILKNNQITVSETSTSDFDGSLSFQGYLAQASAVISAETAYINCFGGGNKV